MSETATAEKQLIRYLLGQLPQAESERLDELSFIDEEFSARLQIIEDDLIDAYTRGQLSKYERGLFEVKYLAVPYLRKRVGFAMAFKDSINVTNAVLPRTQARESRSWLGQLLNYRSVFPSSLRPLWVTTRASVIIAMLSVLTYVILRIQDHDKIAGLPITPTPFLVSSPIAMPSPSVSPSKSPPLPPTVEPKLAVFVLSPGARGSADSRSFLVSRKSKKVPFQINHLEGKYKLYRAVLKTARDDDTVWSSGKLPPTVNKSNVALSITIPTAQLASRTYVMVLKGITEEQAEENVSEYSFRIIMK